MARGRARTQTTFRGRCGSLDDFGEREFRDETEVIRTKSQNKRIPGPMAPCRICSKYTPIARETPLLAIKVLLNLVPLSDCDLLPEDRRPYAKKRAAQGVLGLFLSIGAASKDNATMAAAFRLFKDRGYLANLNTPPTYWSFDR